jgi:hypothetical protein
MFMTTLPGATDRCELPDVQTPDVAGQYTPMSPRRIAKNGKRDRQNLLHVRRQATKRNRLLRCCGIEGVEMRFLIRQKSESAQSTKLFSFIRRA